jgi:hypothetical protein
MNRLMANLAIVNILIDTIEKNPDLRFNQVLYGLMLDNPNFYEESVDTLEHLKGISAEIENGTN